MRYERVCTASPSEPGELDGLYGEDYFQGRTSGYSSEGYPADHPDWGAWCEFLRSLKPGGGRLVDLGCAYGYLIPAACQAGFQAFGFDISSYALRQESDIRPRLALCDAKAVPLAEDSADIVCLFDVLEHLADPMPALRETARVLKGDGIVAGATPDAAFFKRREQTHCFERPASFWLAALGECGLRSAFRFSEEAYNFQFLAAFEASAPLLEKLRHDSFQGGRDIADVQAPLRWALRPGWGPLGQGGSRRIEGGRCAVYLLNPGDKPLRIRASLEVGCAGWAQLRVRWNSHVLADFLPGQEPLSGRLRLPEFLLPSGGHHLFFEPRPPDTAVDIRSLKVECEAADPRDLILELPFDLYQRYRMAADAASALGPQSILDYGGHIGDEDGHLAVSRDFFGQAGGGRPALVLSADVRVCDHPDHIPTGKGGKPLSGCRFDLVACLDVLEHVPPGEREGLLESLSALARKWIVLAAPFDSPQVRAAEERLRGGLMAARRFLREHRELGLPERSLVRDHFQGRGWQVLEFPNGWLPQWVESQILTQHYFAMDDYRAATLFNTLCNRARYPEDQAEPAYRRLFVLSREPLERETEARLREALAPRGSPASHRPLGEREEAFRLHERASQILQERKEGLNSALFLLNERERHIELLKESVKELERLNARPLHEIVKQRLKGGR